MNFKKFLEEEAPNQNLCCSEEPRAKGQIFCGGFMIITRMLPTLTITIIYYKIEDRFLPELGRHYNSGG